MENVNVEINYEEKKVEDSEKLNEQIEELKKEIEEWKKNYAIKLADFDNYKKRINKDFEEYKKYACEKLIMESLKNIDLLDRAIQSSNENSDILEGLKMISKNMMRALETEGVERIITENQKYDPYQHQALATDSIEEMENDMIIEELLSGYKLKGKVIRPAMVKINKK